MVDDVERRLCEMREFFCHSAEHAARRIGHDARSYVVQLRNYSDYCDALLAEWRAGREEANNG